MADRLKTRKAIADELKEHNRLNALQEEALVNAMALAGFPANTVNDIMREAKARIEAAPVLFPRETNTQLTDRLYKLAIDPDLLALIERIIERLPKFPEVEWDTRR